MTKKSQSKKKSSSPPAENKTRLILTSISVLIISIIYYYYAKQVPVITTHRRIIGIGDLHGDLRNTIKVLKMSKIINDKLEWISGTDILVQTGDVVDRGKDAKRIYELLQDLKIQAKANGMIFFKSSLIMANNRW
jgi:hypothetical protein